MQQSTESWPTLPIHNNNNKNKEQRTCWIRLYRPINLLFNRPQCLFKQTFNSKVVPICIFWQTSVFYKELYLWWIQLQLCQHKWCLARLNVLQKHTALSRVCTNQVEFGRLHCYVSAFFRSTLTNWNVIHCSLAFHVIWPTGITPGPSFGQPPAKTNNPAFLVHSYSTKLCCSTEPY